jgi:DNA-binding NarL/FixJ family response regulator
MSPLDPLTNRKLEVLELLTQHLQNKEIAEKPSDSPATVKTHPQNVYQKLNAGNCRDLILPIFSDQVQKISQK